LPLSATKRHNHAGDGVTKSPAFFIDMAWKKQKRIDLNPSSADRWTTCTASPKFIFDNWDRLPEETRTFADPGTSAHEVAAALLQNRTPRVAECPAPIDSDMRWHGWNYMEFVEGLVKPGGRLLVEQKLPLWYAEGRNAIVDAAVINPDGLHIVDYKYGEGIIVSPENNLQATIYAKVVMLDLHETIVPKSDFPVSISIYQPRTRGEDPSHTWETTWGVIREIAHKIFLTANRIQQAHKTGETLDFRPSEKACQWCPAKGFCEARQREFVKDLEMLAVIDDTPKPGGKVLTEKQLAAIVHHGDEIKKWIDDAQAFALQHMKAGGRIEGFKLVTSRGGNRYWSDPIRAAKYLQEDTILRKEELFTEPKIVGPAAVEKLLGKGKIPARAFGLIAKPPGQPVIAPEDDPRESCLVNGASEFTNLDEF